jgi:hypothetical protein
MLRQQREQPPLAPRDAVAAFEQANHRRAADGVQAQQPVVQQFVEVARRAQRQGHLG